VTTNTKKLNTLKDIMDDQTIATDLLLSAKSGVRSLAVAITETATPEIKKLLKRELDMAIDLHDKIVQYMIEKEMYHAYDINEQVSKDLKNANEAMKIGNKGKGTVSTLEILVKHLNGSYRHDKGIRYL
jgi:similar to spore coat protein